MIDLLDNELNEETIKLILKNDYIDRNKYLNGIINILKKNNKCQIISLDGEWGSGKTWFVKSLEYIINHNDCTYSGINTENVEYVRNNYMTFYYNAWENDDAPSAMLSLIYKLVNDSGIEQDNESAGIIKRILNTLVKYVTGGAVDIKQDFFGEQWDNKKITDEIKTSEEIKKDFRELIDTLLIENKNKILIIIDEIDRCKPTFAVDLLENIKHFYNDDRIIFLVATNNKQLGATICKVYGEKYDGSLYLDKIFDINLELPNNYLNNYIKTVDERYKDSSYKYSIPIELAKEYKISMREFNRYLKSLELIDKLLDNFEDGYYIGKTAKYIIIPLAILLKIINKDKYYKFVKGDLFQEIETLIRNNKNINLLSQTITRDKKVESIPNIKEETTKIVIDSINEIYMNIFTKCENPLEKGEYEDTLKNILDIISLLSN